MFMWIHGQDVQPPPIRTIPSPLVAPRRTSAGAASLEKQLEKLEVIRGLLGNPSPSQKSFRKLREAFHNLPLRILKQLRTYGVKIRVIQKGQTPLDVGLVREADPDAFLQAARLFAPIADSLIHWDPRAEVLREKIWTKSDNYFEMLESQAPLLTLKGEAEKRGFRGSREKEVFFSAFILANGDRWERCLADERKHLESRSPSFDPWSLPDPSVPIRIKRYLLVVPGLFFRKGNYLSSLDHQRVVGWGEGKIYAEYYQRKRVILLREDRMERNREGSLIPLHEAGHAFEEWFRSKDPHGYEKYDARRRELFRESVSKGAGFVTGYARANVWEFSAESFAAFFQRPALLKAKNPRMFLLIEDLLA